MYTVPDQSGRTVVVTGANSGTGLEVATRLVGSGARVILAVRDKAKGETALAGIRERYPQAEAEVRLLDLADFASVEEFAHGLARDVDHLDTLVNNAGVMVPPHRFVTVDGHELQWQTNFLGPFALTMRLMPLLLAAPAGRVATMSSGVASWGKIAFNDLDAAHGYRPWRAYAQSKLADLYLATRLAKLSTMRGWSLVSTAAHPGFTRTNLQTSGANLGRRTPKRSMLDAMPASMSMLPPQGAGPLLFAAADPSAANGGYFGPAGRFGLVGEVGPVRLNARESNGATAARLWVAAEQVTGTGIEAW